MGQVSVIIAAYNIEKYIKKCLQSILNQTYKNIQIIVVNDGSTDNTLTIIRDICNNDKRVNIVNQKNMGLIEARKSGYKIALGEYILFVDGDDWLEIDAIEKLYLKANKEQSDVVLYNAFNTYSDLNKSTLITFNKENINGIKNQPIKYLLINEILPFIWAKFIRRKFILENNVEFPKKITYGEDLAFVANLFLYNPQISFLEDSLYNYYQRVESISRTPSKKIIEVSSALEFIELNLKSKDLYDKYEKEYEVLVYNNLLLSKILRVKQMYPERKIVYNQYKKRKIDIWSNKYLYNHLLQENNNFKLRVKLYNYSYTLGVFFDFIRKRFKKVYDNK